jgi:hypothetical protein
MSANRDWTEPLVETKQRRGSGEVCEAGEAHQVVGTSGDFETRAAMGKLAEHLPHSAVPTTGAGSEKGPYTGWRPPRKVPQPMSK